MIEIGGKMSEMLLILVEMALFSLILAGNECFLSEIAPNKPQKVDFEQEEPAFYLETREIDCCCIKSTRKERVFL